MKLIVISIAAAVFITAAVLLQQDEDQVDTFSPPTTPLPTVSESDGFDEANQERAEDVGFQFMQSFSALAPPSPNTIRADFAYNALSRDAMSEVSRQNLANDLMVFIKVQDIPDQGISVEDLQIRDASNVSLIVGLNYTGGGRVLRSVNLIKEANDWRVDSVTRL